MKDLKRQLRYFEDLRGKFDNAKNLRDTCEKHPCNFGFVELCVCAYARSRVTSTMTINPTTVSKCYTASHPS